MWSKCGHFWWNHWKLTRSTRFEIVKSISDQRDLHSLKQFSWENFGILSCETWIIRYFLDQKSSSEKVNRNRVRTQKTLKIFLLSHFYSLTHNWHMAQIALFNFTVPHRDILYIYLDCCNIFLVLKQLWVVSRSI